MKKVFIDREGTIRSIWWIPVFFLFLAGFLFPIIVIAQKQSAPVPVFIQALLILLVTIICQLLRNRSITEITGKFDHIWVKQFYLGILAGAAIMVAPVLLLSGSGIVKFDIGSISISTIIFGLLGAIFVSIAEELLFRGFIFQRLIESLGKWPAQLIISGLFLLTHLNNPGMTGTIKLFASCNIFLASILFGLAFIRTKSLALPIGMHLMANWTQGTLLGFGVSGNHEDSLLIPKFSSAPEILTGGAFGLEASLFGLLTLIVVAVLFYFYYPKIIQ